MSTLAKSLIVTAGVLVVGAAIVASQSALMQLIHQFKSMFGL